MEEIFNNLTKAIENKDKTEITSLLEATKKYKYFHTLYTDVIFNLIEFDDPELIEFALECGANLNAPSSNLEKPLHIAAQLNKIQIVSFLINKDINPDVLDTSNNTPLFFAVRSGSIEAIELLLAKGAEINHSNIFGKTPLIESVTSGNEAVVSLLLNNGANPNIKDRDGNTALMLTQINARKNAREYIVDHSIDNIHYSNAPKKQKLENQFEEIIRRLLSCGASLFLENNQGKTVLNLALPYFYKIIYDALLTFNITEFLNVTEKGVNGDVLTTSEIDFLKNNGLEEKLYDYLQTTKEDPEKITIDGYAAIEIPKDENCFFQSLAMLLNIPNQMTIRSNIANFIAAHPEMYSNSIIPESIERMRTDERVPDEAVQAAATALQTSIIIHDTNGAIYNIEPDIQTKSIHLLYTGTHYKPLITEEHTVANSSLSL